jgi:hypothetical protein
MRQLDDMEMRWTEKQKEKIVERLQKTKREGHLLNHIVHKCKEHGGPFTQLDDLQVLSSQSTIVNHKKIIRMEVQYQWLAHPRDSQVSPDLYKVNRMSIDDMMKNLASIPGAEDDGVGIVFPTEDEVFTILSKNMQAPLIAVETSTPASAPAPVENAEGDIIAVIWDITENLWERLLAQVSDAETLECDHYE